MTIDKRNVLEVLKAELEFLENAGYHHSARAAWRPQFMFQDSPTCLNFDRAQLAKPCSDCVLMQLIPEDLRDKKIPCRYIPLNESGETIDSFYRTGTQEEQETAVAHWLRTTIARLEREKSEGLRDSEYSDVHLKRDPPGSESAIDYDSDCDSTASVPNFLSHNRGSSQKL